MTIEIDQDRLLSEVEALAAISDADPPAVTRIVFTPTDLKARTWLRKRCEEAGLAVRQDSIGNVFARWAGTDSAAPAVGTGSHIDAIPNAGKYDGVVGVLGGLEAIRALQHSGFRPTHSIELLVFTSEEPTRFGIGCLGSRLLSGTLSPDAAHRLKDSTGESIDDVRRKAGVRGDVAEVKLLKGYYKAFVELHIEQGNQHLCSGQHANYDRRLGGTRRRCPDARSSRRSLRRRGTYPGGRECGTKQWRG